MTSALAHFAKLVSLHQQQKALWSVDGCSLEENKCVCMHSRNAVIYKGVPKIIPLNRQQTVL